MFKSWAPTCLWASASSSIKGTLMSTSQGLAKD